MLRSISWTSYSCSVRARISVVEASEVVVEANRFLTCSWPWPSQKTMILKVRATSLTVQITLVRRTKTTIH